MTQETLNYVERKHKELASAKWSLRELNENQTNYASEKAYCESKIKLTTLSLARALDRPFPSYLFETNQL
jgi:hypothetical protein